MKQIPIPADVDEITVEWMQQALSAGGISDFPKLDKLEIKELSDANNMMGYVYRCRMTARDDVELNPASVVIKLPTSHRHAFKLAKWMSLYRRECNFYCNVAPYGHIRAPSLFYCEFDERSHRFVLVLEDLGDMESSLNREGVGAVRTRRAISEIASFQGRFWQGADTSDLPECTPQFISTKEGYIMQMLYLLMLPLVFKRFGDLFTPDTSRLAETLGSRIGAYYAINARGPKTVVHGDYKANSVLCDEGNADFAVIDWQGCGFGCGMYDVAFFLALSVTVDDRRRIEREVVHEYHDILCRFGVENYSREDCWRSYRQNMLGTLIPMILGSGNVDTSDQALTEQTRYLLVRTLTAIEDLDAWEFIPFGVRLFSFEGALSVMSRCFYGAYSGLLNLRKGKKV